MDENHKGKVVGRETSGGGAGLFWGCVASGAGAAVAVSGGISGLMGASASVLPGTVGVCLGILGYFLGAYRFGTMTIIFSIADVFFGLAAEQGLIPGVETTGRGMVGGPTVYGGL